MKKWLPWWVGACTRQSDALHFITSAKDTLEKGTKLIFGIFYKGEMAGIINFNKIDASNDQLAIGYWIGERFQGLGLVIAACSKLIEIGFQTLDLKVIAIRCAVENIRSQKIPTRLGFKKPDMVLKKENVHGTHMDIVVYTIQKDQWLNQKVKA